MDTWGANLRWGNSPMILATPRTCQTESGMSERSSTIPGDVRRATTRVGFESATRAV